MMSKSSQLQLQFQEVPTSLRPREEVLEDIFAIIRAWREARLGGEVMPEDVHPTLERSSSELVHYFTFGMALNYQRNSYSLWRNCTRTFDDTEISWVFRPLEVAQRSDAELRDALTRHSVALQPNNHVRIWRRIAVTFTERYEGDARILFFRAGGDIGLIKQAVVEQKRDFPYLAGPKILNYWLYVISQYTRLDLRNKGALTVAPDTHVINASQRLGLISSQDKLKADAGLLVADRWKEILLGTQLDPIDVHTPLWLWSRAGFPPVTRSGR